MGQIETEFPLVGEKLYKQYGTGSLQIDEETDELYVLSCAHIFVRDCQEKSDRYEGNFHSLSPSLVTPPFYLYKFLPVPIAQKILRMEFG